VDSDSEVGFAGVWLLINSGAAGGGAVEATGARSTLATAAVLFACVSWAAGSLYAARAPMPASAPLAAAVQMLAGGALMTIIGTLAGEWRTFDPSKVSAASAVAFAYLVLFGALVAFTAYSWLLRVASPTRVATYAYVNPLIAVFLGWAVAGEQVGPRTLVAAGVITAAVVIIVTRRPVAAKE
jgi:drug/metabolite transporter (DMT)-like permease